MRGRPADPSRAKRPTGNRARPGEAKAAKSVLVLPGVGKAVKPVEFVNEFPMPSTLPVQVEAVWDRAVADLGGSGRMRVSYIPQLSAYCEAVYLHARASAELADGALTVPGSMGGLTVNPLIRIQKDAAATLLRFADSLGLTPAARMRLALEEVTGMSILQSLNGSLDGLR